MMIFSPFDALLFRRRSPAAQRRVEIFVGLILIVVGAPCGYFAENTSLLARLCLSGFSLAGGIYMVARAARSVERERVGPSDAPESDSSDRV